MITNQGAYLLLRRLPHPQTLLRPEEGYATTVNVPSTIEVYSLYIAHVYQTV